MANTRRLVESKSSLQTIAAPVVLGVDLTKDLIHRASSTLSKASKAAASSVEKMRRGSNDSLHGSFVDTTAGEPNEQTDEANETTTLVTALQRPQRRKYRPVDGADKDDDSASFHKGTSDAAAVRAKQ